MPAKKRSKCKAHWSDELPLHLLKDGAVDFKRDRFGEMKAFCRRYENFSLAWNACKNGWWMQMVYWDLDFEQRERIASLGDLWAMDSKELANKIREILPNPPTLPKARKS